MKQNNKLLENNIWKFYLYKFLRGLWIPATIWVLYFLARGFDYGQIGMTDIVYSVVVILFEIPSGAFADLIGRKYSVFLGYTVLAISILCIGLTGNYYAMLIILAVYGIGETFFSGADDAVLFDTLKVLKKEQLYAQIDGKANAIFSLGSIFGGFIGAYLFSLNITYPYIIGAIVFFLTGVSFLFMKEPSKVKTKYSIKQHYRQVIDGCKYVKKHPQVRWIIAFCAIIASFFGYQIFVVQPSLTQFGFDIRYFGVLFAIIWGLEAIIYWNAHKILDFLGEKKAIFAIGILHVFAFIALSFIDFWLGLVFIVINYFGRGLYYPITHNYIQKHIQSSHRATTLSVQNFIVALFGVFVIYVFSNLTDMFSIRFVYFLSGVILAVFLIGFYVTFPLEMK